MIFNIKYKKELLDIEGDVGAREIVNRQADDVLQVDVDCKGVLIDIDTLADFQNHSVENEL